MNKNRRIIVIDDNESIHEDFRKILGKKRSDTSSLDEKEGALFGEVAFAPELEGFDIDFANQGEKGLEMILRALVQGRPYSVAFVDVRMPPGWDGLETIEHAWNADPNIQFVICSAYSDHTGEEIIRRLGVSDRLLLLKKPCDAVEILFMAVAMNEKWNAYAANPAMGIFNTQSVISN